MTAYQLIYVHENSRDTFVIPGKIYSSRKEAEKAKAFAESVPDNPYYEYTIQVFIDEVEILDKFEPWFSEEQLARMKQELEYFYGEEYES